MSQQPAQSYDGGGEFGDPPTTTGPASGSTTTGSTTGTTSSTTGTTTSSTGSTTGGGSGNKSEAAKDVAHTAKDEAASVAGTAKEQAGEVAGEARNQARQLWQESRHELMGQAGQQQQRLASSLRTLADDLSSMSSQGGQPGMAQDVVREVSGRASRAASWLEQREPGSLVTEVRSFARQRPGTFLAIAAGLGVLGGRFSRSMVDESREQDDASSSQDGSVGRAYDVAPGTRTGPATQSTTGYPDGVVPARTGLASDGLGGSTGTTGTTGSIGTTGTSGSTGMGGASTPEVPR